MRAPREAATPRVVGLDRSQANALEVGGELYVFLSERDPALVPARCPHRGGPLHVARVEDGAKGPALVCPWHESKVPVRALRARALATVQVGDQVRAVVEAPADAPVYVRHVPVSVGDRVGCGGGCAREEELS
ncbi:MAG: Rieske 2Fe-2S domain-containing protein [Polyangiales bacterium]